MSDFFPLDVTRMQILRNDQAFQVVYLANDGPYEDIVIQLTLALPGVTFAPGQDVPLQGEYQVGHQRTTVTHLAAGEAEIVLPPVQQGDLHLSAGGDVGQRTIGNFSLSFAADAGQEVGSGRTLYGSFAAVAQDAGFGPGI